MKIFLRLIALFLMCSMMSVLWGCQTPKVPDSAGHNDPTLPVANPNDGIIDVGQEALPYSEDQLYLQLFDSKNKIEVDLDMPDAELQKLQDDYDRYREMGSKSPIYRKANVSITITNARDTVTYRIPEVGVRMKGNTSRTDFYNAEEGIYNFIHLRLDFQETFTDETYYGSDRNVWNDEKKLQQRKDRTFATLEKLELRWNKNRDSTYLRETYAYEVYRSEGVLAPNSNLSVFTWNDARMGIYVLVEPIDKIFIERNLPKEDWDGDLYKCGWVWLPVTFTSQKSIGIENEDAGEFYTYDLKTNKKTSEHESLKKLLTGLNSGAVTKESFGSLVDMDYFLRYAAVSYFLGNPDDLRNNFNNCYIYFLKSTGKMIVIPYDYDRCLGVTVDYNPSGHGMTAENPFSDRAEGKQDGPGPQESPLFLLSVAKGGFYVKEYAAVLEEVAANQLLKPDTFATRYHAAANLYSKDVTPERTLHNADTEDFSFNIDRTDSANGNNNMSFKDYITAKKSSFLNYMKNIDQYTEYVRPVDPTFFIRGDFNDWSNRNEYGMTVKDGKMVYTLTMNRNFSFKVFDNINQEWYGTEFFPEDLELEFETNRHDNIILSPGTYEVVFDPENLILTVTKK